MDNLTHALTGLMLSRAGLNRLTPRASLLLMVAANAPDADVIGWAGGTPAYLEWHRGPTHSLFFVPLVAAAVSVLVCLPRRPAGLVWWKTILAASIAVLSHLLLDLTNIYGIRLLSPWWPDWFRLDITPVIDPWIWVILLIGVLWPALARLVSGEIGARSTPGTGTARFVLVLLLGWDYMRYEMHGRAVETINARVYEGRAPRRAIATPALANPFRWRGVLDLGGAWHTVPVNLLAEFDPTAGQTYYDSPDSPARAAAMTTAPFRALRQFSHTVGWRELPAPDPEGAVEVSATDVRFADPGEERFAAVAIVTREGNVAESTFRLSPRGGRIEPR